MIIAEEKTAIRRGPACRRFERRADRASCEVRRVQGSQPLALRAASRCGTLHNRAAGEQSEHQPSGTRRARGLRSGATKDPLHPKLGRGKQLEPTPQRSVGRPLVETQRIGVRTPFRTPESKSFSRWEGRHARVGSVASIRRTSRRAVAEKQTLLVSYSSRSAPISCDSPSRTASWS